VAEQRRLPSGWLKRRLQRLVKMAARRVVVAAVAQAVSELQSSEADSDQHLNQMLTHLTECCRSLSSATNIAEHLADDLRSGTSIKYFADVTVLSYGPSEFRQHFRMGRACCETSDL